MVKNELMESLLIDAEAALEASEEKCDKLQADLIIAKSDASSAKAALAISEKAREASEKTLKDKESKEEKAESDNAATIIKSNRSIETKLDNLLKMEKKEAIVEKEKKREPVKIVIPDMVVVRGADGKVARLVARE